MTNLLYGRTLFGASMGFHVIFAFIGVGLPLFVCVAELLAIKTKNENYRVFARRLSYALVMVFTVGAISGTVVSLQLSLLWPKFMELMSQVNILPFALEGYAFFLEAIFLIIYIAGWTKMKNQFSHWLTSIPLVIGSAASSFFITSANAFMHTPAGFTMVNGEPRDIHPLLALFNPATPTETAHVLASAYLNTALIIAGLFAFFIAIGKTQKYYKQILTLAMVGVAIFGVLTFLSGDRQGKFIAQSRPLELAALEAHFKTEAPAPLELAGIIENNKLVYSVKVPVLLSFLAFGDFKHQVQGLYDFPQNIWPPLFIHYAFTFMVAMGAFYIVYALWYFFLLWRKKTAILYSKINLWILAIAGMASFLVVDAGWETVEAARQPWIIYDVMQVKDAFTTSPYVPQLFWVFMATFTILLASLIAMLLAFFKRRPLEKDGVIT